MKAKIQYDDFNYAKQYSKPIQHCLKYELNYMYTKTSTGKPAANEQAQLITQQLHPSKTKILYLVSPGGDKYCAYL